MNSNTCIFISCLVCCYFFLAHYAVQTNGVLHMIMVCQLALHVEFNVEKGNRQISIWRYEIILFIYLKT